MQEDVQEFSDKEEDKVKEITLTTTGSENDSHDSNLSGSSRKPTKEEMLQIFRSGGYAQLIPYFKEELSGYKSLQGIRYAIMKWVDPESYAKSIERLRERRARKEP